MPSRPAHTIQSAAKELAVSTDIVDAHIASGAIVAFDVAVGRGKRRWRITAESLDEFIRARSNTTTPVPMQKRRKHSPPEVTEYY
jgi:hypothetical protein